MGLICFHCTQKLRELWTLKRRLRFVHAVDFGFGATGQYHNFVCCQGGCHATFRLFNSYVKHIRKYHVSAEDIVNEVQGLNATDNFIETTETIGNKSTSVQDSGSSHKDI